MSVNSQNNIVTVNVSTSSQLSPKAEDPRTAKLFSQGISLAAKGATVIDITTYLLKAEKIEKKLEPLGQNIDMIKSFLSDLKNPTIPNNILSNYIKEYFSPELTSVLNGCLDQLRDGKEILVNHPRILLQLKNAQGENILESYLAQQNIKLNALRELVNLYRSIVSSKQPASAESTCRIRELLIPNLFQFTLSHVLTEGIAPTDTLETANTILKLHQLQDFYTFLHSSQQSNEFIYEKFQELDCEIKTALGEAIWAACYSPDEPFFTDHLIRPNPQILLECINSDGVDIIVQLMEHYKAKVELQRFKTNFLGFVEKFKTTQDKNARLKLFENLPKSVQEDLRKLLWLDHGGKNDPQFGHLSYGTDEIEKAPDVLLPILDLYITVLEGKISFDIRQGAAKFVKEKQLPKEPIDCSLENFSKGVNEKIPANMKITMVAAEYAGVISMGGLAPAVAGMARAYGPDARIILPKYDVINPKLVLKEKEKYQVTINGESRKVYKTKVGGIKCYLIEDPLFNVGFDKDKKPNNIYEGSDVDTKRRWAHFASLSADLVYQFSTKEKNPVELVHVHDAQTGLVPKILLSRHYPEWKNGKTPAAVFTFHNNNSPLAYDYPDVQRHLTEIGLPWKPHNAFMEGLEYSDMNTTVSKSFAEEVQTEFHGKGMQRQTKIQAHVGKLAGIVNGNTDGWNPKTDEQLKKWVTEDGIKLDLTYGPDDKDLDTKKMLIRQQLVEYLHNHKLAEIDPRKPIFFYVGRYDAYQKGIDKLPVIMDEALNNDAQFICIGLDPDPKADGILKEMELIAKKRGNKGMCVIRDFKRPSDGRLHWQQGNTLEDRSGVTGFGNLLRAAVDLGIFPSIFEPCGLVQGEMHRMGTETIATEIGGFKDTIFTKGPNRNGYLFERHPNWESKNQDESIRASVHKAANEQYVKLDALYSGDEQRLAPFIQQSRTIMANAAKSTWTSTFDGSPSPIEQIKIAYAKAIKHKKMRGKILIDIHGLKKA